MEAIMCLLGTLLLTICLIIILGFITIYMFLAMLSLAFKAYEEKKEKPDENYIDFFRINATFHFMTVLMAIGALAITIIKNS